MIRRRKLLASISAVGTVVVAGCIGGDSATEGDDDTPINLEPEELLPLAELFGDEWEQGDRENGSLHPVDLEGNTAFANFVANDGDEGISVEVTVYDTVEEAMSGYEEMRDHDSGDPEFEEIEIASEGYILDIQDAIVYFRDANVIGELGHVNVTGRSTPEQYASSWHETWRE